MIHGREDYNRRIQDKENLIPIDEPVFLLRAQDTLASIIVMIYAEHLRLAGGSPEHVKHTIEQARAMEKWPTKKMPDLIR